MRFGHFTMSRVCTIEFHESLLQAWTRLLDLAEKRLELASSYWSLRGKDVYVDPSDWQGEDIYARLVNGEDNFLKRNKLLSE